MSTRSKIVPILLASLLCITQIACNFNDMKDTKLAGVLGVADPAVPEKTQIENKAPHSTGKDIPRTTTEPAKVTEAKTTTTTSKPTTTLTSTDKPETTSQSTTMSTTTPKSTTRTTTKPTVNPTTKSTTRNIVVPPPTTTKPTTTTTTTTQPPVKQKLFVHVPASITGIPRKKATLTIKGAAGKTYSITAYSPKGNRLKAQGLDDKPAGKDGKVSWTWMVGSNTQPGTGVIEITCEGELRTVEYVVVEK